MAVKQHHNGNVNFASVTYNFDDLLQEMEIRKAAKEGNKEVCTLLAKQLVQMRKAKTRTYAAKGKVSSNQS